MAEREVIQILDTIIDRHQVVMSITDDHIELTVGYAIIEVLTQVRDEFAKREGTQSTS